MVDTNNITRIEYTILGTVLMEAEHTGEVVAALAPTHFSNLGTRGLFEAISSLHFKGAPVDPVTVTQEAGANYEVAVREALQYCTAVSNLPYYCEMLKEQGQLCRVQAEAMGLAAAENLQNAREVLDRLNGLMVSRKGVEILNATEAASDFYDRQGGGSRSTYTGALTSWTPSSMPSRATSSSWAAIPAREKRCCPCSLP